MDPEEATVESERNVPLHFVLLKLAGSRMKEKQAASTERKIARASARVVLKNEKKSHYFILRSKSSYYSGVPPSSE